MGQVLECRGGVSRAPSTITLFTLAPSHCFLRAGKGIPVVMHTEHKVYVPELIFGHLLTSSNYDDEEKKGEQEGSQG